MALYQSFLSLDGSISLCEESPEGNVQGRGDVGRSGSALSALVAKCEGGGDKGDGGDKGNDFRSMSLVYDGAADFGGTGGTRSLRDPMALY